MDEQSKQNWYIWIAGAVLGMICAILVWLFTTVNNTQLELEGHIGKTKELTDNMNTQIQKNYIQSMKHITAIQKLDEKIFYNSKQLDQLNPAVMENIKAVDKNQTMLTVIESNENRMMDELQVIENKEK